MPIRSITTRLVPYLVTLPLLGLLLGNASASDWVRFRGPNGSGISREAIPQKWSTNIRWQVKLPGPGLSSPIVVGDRIFVTCWTGYGAEPDNDDEQTLRRHVVCLAKTDGRVLWDKTVDPYLPEDPFRGMFAENGYASHSPVTDGERVYVFFGKTGALAFSLNGDMLWQTSVGHESGPRGWGSASSPILYEDLMIVTASAESEALVALNKHNGEEVWRKEATGFSGTWATPILVETDQRTELVLAVPGEVWSFAPKTGKLLWYCLGPPSNSVCASLIVDQDVVYAIGRREGGSVAIRTGGSGDVTDTHTVWTKNHRAGIGTPLLFDQRIYWINNQVARCIDTKTGENVFEERVSQRQRNRTNPSSGSERRRSGRRFGGRGQDYSSPVAAQDHMFFIARSGQVTVMALKDDFQILANDQLGDDEEQFSATPAIANGAIFVRSNKRLYCIAE